MNKGWVSNILNEVTRSTCSAKTNSAISGIHQCSWIEARVSVWVRMGYPRMGWFTAGHMTPMMVPLGLKKFGFDTRP